MIGKLASIAGIVLVALWIALSGEAAAQSTCVMSGGSPAFASGLFSFACGDGANAIGFRSTSVGDSAGSLSNGGNSGNTAIGSDAGAIVNGANNTAIGSLAGREVVGDNNTAMGVGAGEFVQGSNNVAIGSDAGSGVAFDESLVRDNSSSIGAGAIAGHNNSTALGAGATTVRADQMALGTATNTYTLTGIGSADSLAAQDPVSVRFVTSDLAGNLALSAFDPSTLATSTSVAALDSRVTSLESTVGENREEARGGTALALAAAGLRYDDRPEKLSIAGGVGHFKGMTGLSFGVGYATSDSFRINGAIAGVPELGDVGFSAGLSWTLN